MRHLYKHYKGIHPTLLHFIFLYTLVCGQIFAFEYIHTFLQDEFYQEHQVKTYDLTVGIYYITTITTYFLLPILSYYVSHNFLLFMGCVLYICTFLFFPFFVETNLIYVVMITMGISFSILSSLSLILLQANTAQNKQAVRVALLYTIGAFSSLVAPFLIPIFKATHLTFFYFGGLILALFSIPYFCFRKRFGIFNFPHFKHVFQDSWAPIRLFFRYPFFLVIVIIISFQSSIGEGYLTMWGEVSHLSRNVSEYLSGTYYLGAIFFTLPLSSLQDKIDFEKLMVYLSIVMITVLTIMIYSDAAYIYLIASAILGATIFTQYTLTLALVSRLFGEHLSFSITLFLTLQHMVGLGGFVVVDFGVNGLEYWMIGTNIVLIITLIFFHRQKVLH